MKTYKLLLAAAILSLSQTACNSGSSTTKENTDEKVNTESTSETAVDNSDNSISTKDASEPEATAQKTVKTHAVKKDNTTTVKIKISNDDIKRAVSMNKDEFIANHGKFMVENNDYHQKHIIQYSIMAEYNDTTIISELVHGYKLPSLAQEKIDNAKPGTIMLISNILIEDKGDTIKAPSVSFKFE